MEAWLKILGGIGLLFVALGFLYRPGWIYAVNALARGFVFNDSLTLLHRRRLGLLFFFASGLFFFSGFNNLARGRETPSSFFEVEDAYRGFRARKYHYVVARCQEVLAREPGNAHAWILLGSAWSALGQEDKAREAWEKASPPRPE